MEIFLCVDFLGDMQLQTQEPAEYFNRAIASGEQARAGKIECACSTHCSLSNCA